MDSLIELIGKPVESKAVQAVVAAEKLRESSDPAEYGDSEETRRHYFSSHAGGYELVHSGGSVQTVFLYILPNGEFRPFTGPLVTGLTATDTRTTIRERFGTPTFSGEVTNILGLGRQGPWDRWDHERSCVHIQYTEADETPQLITVMSISSAP